MGRVDTAGWLARCMNVGEVGSGVGVWTSGLDQLEEDVLYGMGGCRRICA